MNLLSKFLFFYFIMLLTNILASENFSTKAKNLFEQEKYNESKFLFQRNIVFNPKDAESYLYLAKIYNFEKNETEN